MLTKTLTLHGPDGVILWHYHANAQGFDASKVVGSYPWDWIAPEDSRIAMVAFALALIDKSEGAVRYHLNPTIFPGEWVVETAWHKIPSADLAVVGISSTWNAIVESLTSREREVAKMLPKRSPKEIAVQLDLSARTVEAIRQRISHKIGEDKNLIAWCTAHRDIL